MLSMCIDVAENVEEIRYVERVFQMLVWDVIEPQRVDYSDCFALFESLCGNGSLIAPLPRLESAIQLYMA